MACQQGNRIPEVLSFKKEELNYLNDCLRKWDCGIGRAPESWIPHNFGFLLKAEIWQLLLEKGKESRRFVDDAGML